MKQIAGMENLEEIVASMKEIAALVLNKSKLK